MENGGKELLKQTTVLFVEDEDEVRDHVEKILSMVVKTVYTAKNGLEGLEIFRDKQNEIDLVITDINMPKMDGLKMSTEIKRLSSTTPIIIATAHNDSNFLHKAISLGVVGYVMKPIDLYQMINAMVRAVEPEILRKSLLQKNAELEELNKTLEQKVKDRTKELEYLATMDPLTDINNRRNFFKLSSDALLDAIKENKTFFAVMIDIDNFKNVNDTYGHAAGDDVIRSLIAAVIENLNPTDIFGRLGGEEFAIIFCDVQKDNILTKIEKIRCDVEKIAVVFNEYTIKYTISTGISCKQTPNDTIDIILARADQALYEAKNEGKNRVKFRV